MYIGDSESISIEFFCLRARPCKLIIYMGEVLKILACIADNTDKPLPASYGTLKADSRHPYLYHTNGNPLCQESSIGKQKTEV
jgi:hypothetical protein